MRRLIPVIVGSIATALVTTVVPAHSAAATPLAWSTPLSLEMSSVSAEGTVVDVAVNSGGDAVAVYVVDGYAGLGDALLVSRYVDGVWHAPEHLPFPVPYTVWVWWSGYYGTPRVALNDSGEAVVAVWATMRRSDTWEEKPVVWAATSGDITQGGSFGGLQRVDADDARRARADVSVSITDNGDAAVGWVGEAAEDRNVAVAYAALRPMDTGAWRAPSEFARDVSGPLGMGSTGTETTFGYVQHTQGACANPDPAFAQEKVACHAAAVRTFDFTTQSWGSSGNLATPSAWNVGHVVVARNGSTDAYAWTQDVAYPFFDNGSRSRVTVRVDHGGTPSDAVQLDAPSVDSRYEVEAIRATASGEAIVVATGCRYIEHGLWMYCRPGVETAEYDGVSWTQQVLDYDDVSGGYETSPPALGLARGAASLDGAVIAWIRGPRSEDLSTEGLTSVRRVSGEWIAAGAPEVRWPSSTSNLGVGTDSTGNAILAGMGTLRDYRDWDFTSPFVSMLGGSSTALGGPPKSLSISDGRFYEGRPIMAVSFSHGVKFNSSSAYVQSISYELQLYKVNGDGSESIMTGLTCSSSQYSCSLFDDPSSRLAEGTYVVRGRATVGEHHSDWSAPSAEYAYVPVKTPSNPGWGVSASSPSRGRVTLSWLEPDSPGWSPITGYRIEYQRGGEGPWRVLKASTNSTALSFTSDPTLATGFYQFRVWAVNPYGYGVDAYAVSSPVEVQAVAAPGAVRNLVGTAAKNGSKRTITFSWAAPSDVGGSPLTGYQYRIKRGAGSWSSWESLAKTVTSLRYTVTARQAMSIQVRATTKPGSTVLVGVASGASATGPA